MVIGDGRQAELWVCFNPAFCLDGMSRVMDEVISFVEFLTYSSGVILCPSEHTIA